MNDFEGNYCNECGMAKTKLYSELNFEERIIADRRAENQTERAANGDRLVCARCFRVVSKPEANV